MRMVGNLLVSRRWLWQPRLVAVLLVLLAGAGCSKPNTAEVSHGLNDPGAGWDHPLGSGIAVASAAEAAPRLAFGPVVPDPSLGAPLAIYASDPDVYPIDGRELAFVYDHSEYGRFFVLEYVGRTQEFLEGSIAECAPEGCVEDWRIVTLANGRRAILGRGPSDTGVNYADGPVEILIIGPNETFSMDAALAVGNAMPAAEP